MSEGHEQWNFKPKQGKCYGYIPRSACININRLGAKPTDTELTDVTVVFAAKCPLEKVIKVVGWYTNAVVYRSIHRTQKRSHLKVETSIVANEEDTKVIDVSSRDIVLPTAGKEAGGFGQSPVWYADKHPDIIQQVRQVIDSGENKDVEVKSSHLSRSVDVEKRKKVEKVAMDAAMAYFSNPKDVSKENKGWDIESNTPDGIKLIEVKGLSGNNIRVELTPNEFSCLQQYASYYILFIVNNALSKNPKTHIFHNTDKNNNLVWETSDKVALNFTKRTGAIAEQS